MGTFLPSALCCSQDLDHLITIEYQDDIINVLHIIALYVNQYDCPESCLIYWNNYVLVRNSQSQLKMFMYQRVGPVKFLLQDSKIKV